MAAVVTFTKSVRSTFSRFLVLKSSTRGIGTTQVRNQTASEEDGDGEQTKESLPARVIVDPDTSIRYLASNAYKECYGDQPVWVSYRRNFKGARPPKTRRSCYHGDKLATGNPCPVCRDEYLVLHHKNVKLLEQFISPYTGEVLDSKLTKICQKQFKLLQVEVLKAEDHGYLKKSVPFRVYDYSQYWDEAKGTPL